MNTALTAVWAPRAHHRANIETSAGWPFPPCPRHPMLSYMARGGIRDCPRCAAAAVDQQRLPAAR
jgi:hypothetical protein